VHSYIVCYLSLPVSSHFNRRRDLFVTPSDIPHYIVSEYCLQSRPAYKSLASLNFVNVFTSCRIFNQTIYKILLLKAALSLYSQSDRFLQDLIRKYAVGEEIFFHMNILE
jgi:hypothetical protein